MDYKTKIYCLKTAIRIFINTTERLEKDEKDWEVGCRCNTEEVQRVLADILERMFHPLSLPCIVKTLCVDEKYVVAVASTLTDDKPQNLLVRVEEESHSDSDDSSSGQESHDLAEQVKNLVVSSAIDELDIIKQTAYEETKKAIEEKIKKEKEEWKKTHTA